MGRGRSSRSSQHFMTVLGEHRGPFGEAATAPLWRCNARANPEVAALTQRLCACIAAGDYETAISALNASGPRNQGKYPASSAAARDVLRTLVAALQKPYSERVDALALKLTTDLKILSPARLPAAINSKLRKIVLSEAESALENATLSVASIIETMDRACDALVLDAFARCLRRENTAVLTALGIPSHQKPDKPFDLATWRLCLEHWLQMEDKVSGMNSMKHMSWEALHTIVKKHALDRKLELERQAAVSA